MIILQHLLLHKNQVCILYGQNSALHCNCCHNRYHVGPLPQIAIRWVWPIWSRTSYQMHCPAWMRPSWLLQRISPGKLMLKHKPQFVHTIKLLLLCFRYLLRLGKCQNRNCCLSMVEFIESCPLEIGNYFIFLYHSNILVIIILDLECSIFF